VILFFVQPAQKFINYLWFNLAIMKTKKIPASLRTWFVIHFITDMCFGLPLLFFPQIILNLFGFFSQEYVMARLVGAALIGIGGSSVFAKTKENYDILLTLKVIWSISALIGLLISYLVTYNKNILMFIVIFGLFSSVWIYYKFRL